MDMSPQRSRRRLPLVIALVVVAIALSTWFAVGIRQAHDTAAALRLLAGGRALSAAEAAHADALLRSAAQLNPDRQVAILRAQAALQGGERRRAGQLLAPVLRREPQNVLAWQWLARTASDAATFARAVAHIGYLDAHITARPPDAARR